MYGNWLINQCRREPKKRTSVHSNNILPRFLLNLGNSQPPSLSIGARTPLPIPPSDGGGAEGRDGPVAGHCGCAPWKKLKSSVASLMVVVSMKTILLVDGHEQSAISESPLNDSLDKEAKQEDAIIYSLLFLSFFFCNFRALGYLISCWLLVQYFIYCLANDYFGKQSRLYPKEIEVVCAHLLWEEVIFSLKF
ncbi:hypothetical protein Nepgr_020069 [Nepenthes gracilis]|uniref:Uncharacterized protein n=1 Tax=Nepenthes gracilis TaxID=150966 RepID=A0AAD3SUG0_NEPGR|nr:hypothetical protein Nepgr_020069 [Nepenthes gracilis]